MVEVLAAIAILAFVGLSFSYVFTQTYKNSLIEEKSDISVSLARTVMEELKMSRGANVTIFNQTVNLNNFKKNPPTEIILYYPNVDNPEYEITIRKKDFGDRYFTLRDVKSGESKTFDISNYVTLVQVEVTHIGFETSYVLENYLDFPTNH